MAEGTAEGRKRSLVFTNLILHLHPKNIPEATLKFTHTWGLGGMAAVLVVLQMFTGLLLRFQYEPFPASAYDSILYIQEEVLFGQMVRNIHHFSGIFMVLIVFLHLLRTFYTEAFHPPRHTNWLFGVALLFVVIFSNFTGYLLPWDQLAFWAITVSSSMLLYFPVGGEFLQHMLLGGPEVGSSTLITFYDFHTGILPLTLIILMVYHFWKVRKAGGVVIPRREGEPTPEKRLVPTIPHLVVRELVVALVLLALILMLSVFFDAPLLDRANPVFSPNPAKSPWYFAGIQELIMHFHPLFAVFIIPILMVAGLALIPYFRYDHDYSGIWFSTRKGRKLVIISSIIGFIITPLMVITDEFISDADIALKNMNPVISEGLFPFILLFLAGILYYYFLKIRYRASSNELVQAMFTLMVMSYIMLTVIGIWFRGPGMALTIG